MTEEQGPAARESASPSLDELVEEVNRQVLADMQRLYSPQVIDRFYNPRNLGRMQEANGHACITGPCGDTMEIWLLIEAGRIGRASFMTDGCGPTIASGSMATELAAENSTDEAAAVGQQDILDALGGLPEESRHCALLAANTLKAAILDYFKRRQTTGGEQG